MSTSQPAATVRRSDEYQHLVPQVVRLPQLARGHPERIRIRGELATGFLPVVTHIATRYGGRGEPIENLQQVGTVGLLGALDRYAPPPGIVDPVGAFLGFAVPTVTGEIRRHFRDRAWMMRVPRGTKELLGPIREATDALVSEHRRAPRPSEIAARLGVGVDQVVNALHAQHAYQPESLDVPVATTGTLLAERLGDLDAALETAEYRHELRAALDGLPARERHMLVLRFFRGMTQTQIGEEVGLSQMHVSRLLGRSLATLRHRMAPTSTPPRAAGTAGG